jgi:hypothetical protein
VLVGKAAWSAIEPIVEEQKEFHCYKIANSSNQRSYTKYMLQA